MVNLPTYKTIKPADLKRATEECITQAREIIEGVLSISGKRTIENTLEPLNECDIVIGNASSKLAMLHAVHPRKEIRLASEKYLQQISNFYIEHVSLSPEIFAAVEGVDTSKASKDTIRHKKELLRDFRRSGVDKEKSVRDQIFAIYMELVDLEMQFDRNNNDSAASITVSGAQELEGVPVSTIRGMARDKDGRIVVTTNYSDYFAVMQFAKSEDVRRQLAAARNKQAPENDEILRKILKKRHKLAQLLGYRNWADYVAEIMMTRSAKTIEEFIKKLDASTKKAFKKEAKMITDYMTQDGISASYIGDWNRLYYSELTKSREFNYDPREFMEYFSYHRVKSGILEIYSDLFGIEFVLNRDIDVWARGVECYDVKEKGELLGRIYLDMHPRKGKYGHAACGTLVAGIKDKQIPESFLMCNFTGGRKSDGPALMQFSQVSTFFHEFGHLLHDIFAGKQRWAAFSGISTEHDFVETPSQLLEEWLFDPKVLRRLGVHYKTGEPIPESMIEKLRAAEEFGKALHVRRQAFLASVSFYFHTCSPGERDLEEFFKELESRYSPFVYGEDEHMWTSFGHLGGYSSNYYTYMWSLAIAKDLLTGFDKGNLMNKNIAHKYRKKVLEPGGSRDAADLVESFLGRPYSFDAFEEWLNS